MRDMLGVRASTGVGSGLKINLILPGFFVYRIINLKGKYRGSQNQRDSVCEDDRIIRYRYAVD